MNLSFYRGLSLRKSEMNRGNVVTAPYFFTRADDAGEAVAIGSYPALQGENVNSVFSTFWNEKPSGIRIIRTLLVFDRPWFRRPWHHTPTPALGSRQVVEQA
jgi:hypothetical protein